MLCSCLLGLRSRALRLVSPLQGLWQPHRHPLHGVSLHPPLLCPQTRQQLKTLMLRAVTSTAGAPPPCQLLILIKTATVIRCLAGMLQLFCLEAHGTTHPRGSSQDIVQQSKACTAGMQARSNFCRLCTVSHCSLPAKQVTFLMHPGI